MSEKKTVTVKLVRSVAGTRESHRATCLGCAVGQPVAARRHARRARMIKIFTRAVL
jgi:hypothetical protein